MKTFHFVLIISSLCILNACRYSRYYSIKNETNAPAYVKLGRGDASNNLDKYSTYNKLEGQVDSQATVLLKDMTYGSDYLLITYKEMEYKVDLRKLNYAKLNIIPKRRFFPINMAGKIGQLNFVLSQSQNMGLSVELINHM